MNDIILMTVWLCANIYMRTNGLDDMTLYSYQILFIIVDVLNRKMNKRNTDERK